MFWEPPIPQADVEIEALERLLVKGIEIGAREARLPALLGKDSLKLGFYMPGDDETFAECSLPA
jgi:hypothetical protein